MSQIFHRSANTISRISIFGAIFVVAGLLVLMAQVNRSAWVTGAQVVREQPIQFSHERHAIVAMSIAVFKATLVVLFFMHVKYSTCLTWAVVAGSVFWLGILLTLTLGII